MFFWNDQFTVSGDARVVGPSDCQISLVSEDEARWEDLVTFVNPNEADSVRAVEVNRARKASRCHWTSTSTLRRWRRWSQTGTTA